VYPFLVLSGVIEKKSVAAGAQMLVWYGIKSHFGCSLLFPPGDEADSNTTCSGFCCNFVE